MLWFLDEWDRAQGAGGAGSAVVIRNASSGGVTDSFNRADNAASLGNADTGQAWIALVGTWGISSNQAACTVHSSNDVAVIDGGLADCTVQVTTAIIFSDSGIAVRATDGLNFIRLIFDLGSASWLLQKCVAGSFTTIGSALGTNANGDVIKLVMSGSNFTAFKNGVQLFTASDAFNSTVTKHGLTAVGTVPLFDNFSIA